MSLQKRGKLRRGYQTDDMGELAGMAVCLALSKLHLYFDWSAYITHVFSCARVIARENAGIDSEDLSDDWSRTSHRCSRMPL